MILVEVISTGLLVAVYLGATRKKARALTVALGVGSAYGVLASFVAFIDQVGLNPARSTATAIFGLGDGIIALWVFWLGPLLGALIVGLVYRAIELPEVAKKSQDEEQHESQEAGEAAPLESSDPEVTERTSEKVTAEKTTAEKTTETKKNPAGSTKTAGKDASAKAFKKTGSKSNNRK